MDKSTLKESQLAKVAALRDRFSSLYQLPPEVFSTVLDIVRGELRRKRLADEAQKLATIAEDVYGEELHHPRGERPSEAREMPSAGKQPKRVILTARERRLPMPPMTIKVNVEYGRLTLCREITDRVVASGETGISLIQYGGYMALRIGSQVDSESAIRQFGVTEAKAKHISIAVACKGITQRIAAKYMVKDDDAAFLVHVRESASPNVWELTGLVDLNMQWE